MGNNHDKYFGSDKRKIIIVGLQSTGKTTLLEYLSTGKVTFNAQKTKNLKIEDVNIANLSVSFFDLAGGERQRVFWKQQFQGTQGIIFLIDVSSSPDEKQKSLDELDKLAKQFPDNIPIAIGLSKIDKVEMIAWSGYKNTLTKQLPSRFPSKQSIRVGQLDYKNPQSIKSLMNWFLSQTKPI